MDDNGDWPGPPLIEGEWRALDLADALSVMHRWTMLSSDASRRMLNYRLLGVRVLDLQCIADAVLVEFAAERLLSGVRGLGALVYRPNHFTILAGASAPLHDLADAALLRLDSAASADQYVRLFSASVQAHDGCFFPFSPAIGFATAADPAIADPARARLLSAPVIEPADNAWTVERSVAYGDQLFRATFRLERSGLIEMTDDQHLCGLRCVEPQGWDDLIRTTGTTSHDSLEGPCPLCKGSEE